MNGSKKQLGKQRGVALVTALLFLLVVTVIAVTAANNSSLGLKMSASMQDAYQSFQSAESGIYAALGLTGSSQDPFRRQNVVADPFLGMSTHPLRNQAADPNDVPVDVDVLLVSAERSCPRPPVPEGGLG
ncbi:MAG: pilus assembly PilX N-terminal domain-containing protein, partial [Pseudomonadota bacterium]